MTSPSEWHPSPRVEADGARDRPAQLAEGAALFNRGAFYDAHEVVEALWRDEARESPRRSFYQAFIQMAGAYLLATQHRQLSGAARLFRSSRAYFEPYRPLMLGFDLEIIVAALARAHEEVERLARGDVAAFDRALIPQV